MANWLKFFNQAASTRCSDDDKEKLSSNVRSELASDFGNLPSDPKFAQIIFKTKLKI